VCPLRRPGGRRGLAFERSPHSMDVSFDHQVVPVGRSIRNRATIPLGGTSTDHNTLRPLSSSHHIGACGAFAASSTQSSEFATVLPGRSDGTDIPLAQQRSQPVKYSGAQSMERAPMHKRGERSEGELEEKTPGALVGGLQVGRK
jgi:hypothetical protein